MACNRRRANHNCENLESIKRLKNDFESIPADQLEHIPAAQQKQMFKVCHMAVPLLLDQLLAHECRSNKKDCMYQCGTALESTSAQKHYEVCPKYPTPCPNLECTNTVLRHDIAGHVEVCGYTPVVCPLSCLTPDIRRYSLESHMNSTCPMRSVSCEKCNDSVTFKSMNDHLLMSCKGNLTQCVNCMEQYPLFQKQWHIDGCPLSFLGGYERRLKLRPVVGRKGPLFQGLFDGVDHESFYYFVHTADVKFLWHKCEVKSRGAKIIHCEEQDFKCDSVNASLTLESCECGENREWGLRVSRAGGFGERNYKVHFVSVIDKSILSTLKSDMDGEVSIGKDAKAIATSNPIPAGYCKPLCLVKFDYDDWKE